MALSAEAQHVVNCLEAHLNAIVAHGRTGSDGARAEIKSFGDQALAALGEYKLASHDDVVKAVGGLASTESTAAA